MTDLILAIAHHVCVFTLAGLLLAEVALLRPGMPPSASGNWARST